MIPALAQLTRFLASKNLYNAALYQMRQQFIQDRMSHSYGELDRLMQPTLAVSCLCPPRWHNGC